MDLSQSLRDWIHPNSHSNADESDCSGDDDDTIDEDKSEDDSEDIVVVCLYMIHNVSTYLWPNSWGVLMLRYYKSFLETLYRVLV